MMMIMMMMIIIIIMIYYQIRRYQLVCCDVGETLESKVLFRKSSFSKKNYPGHPPTPCWILTSSQAPGCASCKADKLKSWQAHRLTSWQVDRMTRWQDNNIARWQWPKARSYQKLPKVANSCKKWHYNNCQNLAKVGKKLKKLPTIVKICQKVVKNC